MIKHVLAVALLGIGIGCIGPMAASTAAPSIAGVAPSTSIADETLVRVGGGRCFELPVAGAVVAFFELLRDEEIDPHCDVHDEGPYHDRYRDDERRYVSEKDRGYGHPVDLKGTPR